MRAKLEKRDRTRYKRCGKREESQDGIQQRRPRDRGEKPEKVQKTETIRIELLKAKAGSSTAKALAASLSLHQAEQPLVSLSPSMPSSAPMKIA